ncbi:hypothetical protein RND71_003098 [Anisodus tanguticus]|uniref:Uncharacterized protein n=1 Tax=Anisodus tanguticus TaxID=243964 RepID=A0AAE1SX99_9SOLA|nr:hypothetical protein RND71_003098 [Anisodus tanguticus]
MNPSVENEKRKNKLKRLVQFPNSFFMTHENICMKYTTNICDIYLCSDVFQEAESENVARNVTNILGNTGSGQSTLSTKWLVDQIGKINQ